MLHSNLSFHMTFDLSLVEVFEGLFFNVLWVSYENEASTLTSLPGFPDGPGGPRGPIDPCYKNKDREIISDSYRIAQKTIRNSFVLISSIVFILSISWTKFVDAKFGDCTMLPVQSKVSLSGTQMHSWIGSNTYSWTRLSSLSRATLETLWPL